MSYFSLSDFTHSDTAVRLGIDNTPPPEVILRLQGTMAAMDSVRALLGYPVYPSSGYRCEALEKVLCKPDFLGWCDRRGLVADGDAWAKYFAGKSHPKGYSCDFRCPGFGTPAKIVAFLRASAMRFDQLIEEGTWVHASFDPAMRGQVLTARFDKNGRPTYANA